MRDAWLRSSPLGLGLASQRLDPAVQQHDARIDPLRSAALEGELGSHLHVANEHSSTVATLAIDPETGLPGEVLHTTPTPSPTCLLALPPLV